MSWIEGNIILELEIENLNRMFFVCILLVTVMNKSYCDLDSSCLMEKIVHTVLNEEANFGDLKIVMNYYDRNLIRLRRDLKTVVMNYPNLDWRRSMENIVSLMKNSKSENLYPNFSCFCSSDDCAELVCGIFNVELNSVSGWFLVIDMCTWRFPSSSFFGNNTALNIPCWVLLWN